MKKESHIVVTRILDEIRKSGHDGLNGKNVAHGKDRLIGMGIRPMVDVGRLMEFGTHAVAVAVLNDAESGTDDAVVEPKGKFGQCGSGAKARKSVVEGGFKSSDDCLREGVRLFPSNDEGDCGVGNSRPITDGRINRHEIAISEKRFIGNGVDDPVVHADGNGVGETPVSEHGEFETVFPGECAGEEIDLQKRNAFDCGVPKNVEEFRKVFSGFADVGDEGRAMGNPRYSGDESDPFLTNEKLLFFKQ